MSVILNRREAATTDIRHVLGEKPNKPGRKGIEDKNALAAKHLEILCKTVLEGDEMRAEQLARHCQLEEETERLVP